MSDDKVRFVLPPGVIDLTRTVAVLAAIEARLAAEAAQSGAA